MGVPGYPQRFLLGGYTEELGGRASGLASRVLTAGGSTPAQSLLPLASPSYLVAHPEQPWVFAVLEGRGSWLASARVQADGALVQVGSVPTGGDFGCHLALSPDARHVVVAHYGSGSVASFEVGVDGGLSQRRDLRQFSGSGSDPERQEGPHIHQVVFDSDVLLVADLGTDRLHRLSLAADGTFDEAGPPIELPGGSGPRHLVVVGGDHLVVVCELSAQLWLGVRTETGWSHAQTVPSSIAELNERVLPSAVRADGDTVYVANRGAGTVSVFTLDRVAHTLTRVQEFSCGGPWPRDLVLGGTRLWVANESTDVVSVFDRTALGAPRLVSEIGAPSPTCVVLLEPHSAAIT